MTARPNSIPVLCVLLLTLCACAATPDIKVSVDYASPDTVLASVGARIPAGSALRALADVRVDMGRRAYPLKLAVLLKRPSSLRLEALPLFGAPVFFLSLNDGTLRVFLAESRSFYVGRATAENMARHLPFKMDPETLIAVLTGSCPVPPGPDTSLAGRPENGRYRIDVRTAKRNWTLWIRTQDGLPEHLEGGEDQRTLFRALYEEPLPVGDSVLPQKITVFFHDPEKVRVAIRFRDMEVVPDVEAQRFDLNPPPGVEPLPLDAL